MIEKVERNERRRFGRVAYASEGIAVVCDTETAIRVGVLDIGPSGVGLILPAETQDLTGKDLILIADTMIMYADVVRQERLEDGAWKAGLSSRKFSRDVLQYLFDSIELESKYEESNDEQKL